MPEHPWEAIYAREGRVFNEPFPRFPEVAQVFEAARCSRILDLGCGSGRHAIEFARRGFSSFGLDISVTGLSLAMEWAAEKGVPAALTRADVRLPLPFCASSFDGLLSTQVIHHAYLAQIRVTIAEIHRILRPGGLAFITVAGSWHEGGPFEEVEPSTYIPCTGSEAGLPHHVFSAGELRSEFSAFQVQEITSRDEGRVLAGWVRKP